MARRNQIFYPMKTLRFILFCGLATLVGCGHLTTNGPAAGAAQPICKRHGLAGHVCAVSSGPLVGVSVSGGGSRAARFTAAVFQKLWKLKADIGGEAVPFMREVDHLSSVSGGSISSAYYVLKKPNGPLTADDLFWDQYKSAMQTNLEADAKSSLTFLPWNWKIVFDKWSLTDFLANRLASNFYGDATLGALYARTDDPNAFVPKLLINSTIYKAGSVKDAIWGQKLVYTPLRSEAFPNDLILGRDLDVEVMTPSKLKTDFKSMSLARAVMSSAAFPGVFEPLHLYDYRDNANRDDPTLYLGDGALHDNLGIETLLQMYSLTLAKQRDARALLIVIDSGRPYSFSGDVSAEIYAGFCIMERRARAFFEIIYRSLYEHKFVDELGNSRIRMIRISFDDPGLDDLQPGLSEQLSKIGTRLEITKDDSASLDRAAELLFSEDFRSRDKLGQAVEKSLVSQLREALQWAADKSP